MSTELKEFGAVTSYEAAMGFGTWSRYVDFTKKLESSETLVSDPAPEVTVISGSGLTISSKAINSSIIVDGDKTVAVGKAVTFRVTTTVEQTNDIILYITAKTSNNNVTSIEGIQPVVVAE